MMNKVTKQPSNPTTGMYPEENRIEKDTYPTFITALITIARTRKKPRCPPADDWMRKLWYVYTMEYYSAIEKECV